QSIFELQTVVLRMWDKEGPEAYVHEVGDAVKLYASSLTTPYCGPAENSPAVEWFAPGIQSLACIALRPDGGHNAFGMLVLGSEDPGRFTSDMGTDYLEVIGRLGAAGLQRLEDRSASEQA